MNTEPFQRTQFLQVLPRDVLHFLVVSHKIEYVKLRKSHRNVKLFAEKEGIVLDNVYTGKAAAGLLDYAKRGLFSPNENVVFIHTGGTVEMFE